jgi:hypothetical protein
MTNGDVFADAFNVSLISGIATYPRLRVCAGHAPFDLPALASDVASQ